MFRWMLLVPLSMVAWYAVFASGLYIHFFVERNFCPAENLVSGFCHNNDIQTWLKNIRYFFVFLSAVIVVLVASSIAPHYKKRVALMSYLTGVVVATYMVVISSAWMLFLAALMGGSIGLWFSLRWVCGHLPDKLT